MKTTNKSTVELLDHMGDDLTVVNAARVSFHKESKYAGWNNSIHEKDEKLINYLASHGHWTPFAHGQLQFRISAPIFVARQLVKHQVGLVWNEVSRRYVDEEPVFYFPAWRKRPEASIKQGSGEVLEEKDEKWCTAWLDEVCETSLYNYNALLQRGVAPEQARIVLPLNTMTEWWWTGSLMAFARVCKQRLDPHAQQECREVAQQINDLIAPIFPVSWKALS